MFKKFRITVEGRIYDVIAEELPSDGIEPAHGPIPPLSVPVAPLHQPPAAPAAKTEAGDEVAPLAGVVDSIDVTIGAKVRIGDKIAVIEAMKMKTDVFAKHSGTVIRIAVKAHEGVETSQVLLTIG